MNRAGVASSGFVLGLLMMSGLVQAQEKPPEPVPAKAAEAPVQEVVITLERGSEAVEIDRKSYKISSSDQTATTPAADVIAQLPNVYVDPRRNISVAGAASVTLLVDGQRVNRDNALQIPAGRIDRIEVITNPSAEFQGRGPFLNIVLKPLRAENVMRTLSGSAETLGGVNLSGMGSASWGPVNVMAMGSLISRFPRESEARSDFTYLVPGLDGLSRRQAAFLAKTDYSMLSGDLSVGRTLSDTRSLSLRLSPLYIRNDSRMRGDERLSYSDGAERLGREAMDSETNSTMFTASATLEDKLKRGHSDQLSVTLYGTRDDGQKRYDRQGLRRQGLILDEDHVNLGISLSGKRERLLPDGKLTFGFTLGTEESEREYRSQGNRVSGVADTNRFDTRSKSAEVYASWQKQFGTFKVMPGLRFVHRSLRLSGPSGRIPGHTDYEGILPSLHLEWTLPAKDTLSLSLTRRVTGGDEARRNPARRVKDLQMVTEGNPNLRFIVNEAAELAYSRQIKGHNLSAILYQRESRNDAESYLTLLTEDVFLERWIALGQTRQSGVSLSLNGKWTPKLSYRLSADLSERRIRSTTPDVQVIERSDSVESGRIQLEYKPNSKHKYSGTLQYIGGNFGLQTQSKATVFSNLQYVRNFSNGTKFTADLINLGGTRVHKQVYDTSRFRGFTRTERDVVSLRLGLSRDF